MVQLASRYAKGGLSQTEELAEVEKVPAQFLAQILGDLRKAGLVESRRGRNGGHGLARPPEVITVRDVIAAIEGEVFLQHDARQEGASVHVVQGVWSKMNRILEEESKAATMQQLANLGQIPMFFI